MGLRERVAQLFLGTRQTEPTTADEAPARPPSPVAEVHRLRADMDRRAVIQRCREMYKTDTRAEGVIRTLARDMVRGGFAVHVPHRADAEDAAAALAQRLGLMRRLDDWVRLTLRDGDSFLELGVNARNEIATVTRKPTLEMHRESDDHDQFADPERAFWLAPDTWFGTDAPGSALWFAEWQILHARWGHDEDSRYGRPLFASATAAWKRMTEGEMDIAVRRKTRAGMKYVHVLEGASQPEIEAYKQNNQDALDNPFAAVTDFFMNRAGGLNVVQGDAHLEEIGDVMHHVRTWFVASPVAMSLLGYGQDLNRDVLEKQEEQYRRALECLTGWVEDEMVKPLLERQWLLAGILPEALQYELVWKAKEPLTAARLRDAADAALRLAALGWPQEMIWSVMGQFLPGVDLEPLMSGAAGGAASEGPAPATRVAGVAQALGSRL